MSMRLLCSTLKDRDGLIKSLHFSKPNTYDEKWNNKTFGTPLPDHSVDCFIYNKENETLDVPFQIGKLLYAGLNINKLISKATFKVEFTGQAREEQVSMIDESIEILKQTDSVLLQGRPGFGKTFISVRCAVEFGFTTLIVVNRTMLLRQWKETVLKFTNGTPWIVGDPLPLDNEGNPKKVDFVISMIDALNKIDNAYLLKFGTLILDEAHMLMTPKQVSAIMQVRPVKLILSTATPDRDVRTTLCINAMVGKDNRVVRKYEGYLKVIKFYTQVMVEEKKRKVGRREKLDWSDLQKKFQAHPKRNQQIIDWVKLNQRKKILILGWGKDHAAEISSMLKKEGVDSDFFAGTKKKYKDSQTLVGSFSKIGAGYDPSSNPDWDHIYHELLIMVGTTKQLASAEQYIGRVFRSQFPHVVIFIDNHTNCESHYKEMMKVISLYSPEIIELNTPSPL